MATFLKGTRKHYNLTLDDIEYYTSIPKGTVHRMETGKSRYDFTFAMVIHAFFQSVAYKEKDKILPLGVIVDSCFEDTVVTEKDLLPKPKRAPKAPAAVRQDVVEDVGVASPYTRVKAKFQE